MYIEFREFFLRQVAVNVGPKPDQEVGFPTQYYVTINGTPTLKYNRFLANHYPSGTVFDKLFNSITFKKNVEDTATETAQGLVRLATYLEAIGHKDALSTAFANIVRPSHIPQIDTVLRASDTAVTMTGNTNTSTSITNVLNADGNKLSYGDPIVGTDIPAGAYVISFTPGVTHGTILISAAATGTTVGVTLTFTNTVAGLKITKAIRTDGTFSRTVYIVETVAASAIPPLAYQHSNVDAILVGSGTNVEFIFDDAIPTGNYIATVTFSHTGGDVTFNTYKAGLTKDSVLVGNEFSMIQNNTMKNVCTITQKIAITLGESIALKVTNQAGVGDVSIGSPRILTLTKVQ